MAIIILAIFGGIAMICRIRSLQHRDSQLSHSRCSKEFENHCQFLPGHLRHLCRYPIGLPEIAAQFLKQFNIFNFDIARVLRIGCLRTMDFVTSISIMVIAVMFLLVLDLMGALNCVAKPRAYGYINLMATFKTRLQWPLTTSTMCDL